MRHILLSGAVTAAAFGMLEAAAAAGLVASSRLAYRVPSGRLRTAADAIDLATVTRAADEYLGPTPGAEKEST